MTDILKRIEEGKGADRILDMEIAWALGEWENLGGGYRRHKVTGKEERFNYTMPDPPITSSLDAALSLVEKKLPGWFWEIKLVSGRYVGAVWGVPSRGMDASFFARVPFEAGPARALLSALLKALSQEDK